MCCVQVKSELPTSVTSKTPEIDFCVDLGAAFTPAAMTGHYFALVRANYAAQLL